MLLRISWRQSTKASQTVLKQTFFRCWPSPPQHGREAQTAGTSTHLAVPRLALPDQFMNVRLQCAVNLAYNICKLYYMRTSRLACREAAGRHLCSILRSRVVCSLYACQQQRHMHANSNPNCALELSVVICRMQDRRGLCRQQYKAVHPHPG